MMVDKRKQQVAVLSYNRVLVGAIPIRALVVLCLHSRNDSSKQQPLVANGKARPYSANHLCGVWSVMDRDGGMI